MRISDLSSDVCSSDLNYQLHLNHLTLKGLRPKTVEAYSRAIRRMGEYFDHRIDALTEAQLVEYFTDLIESHSWSTVKLDLYGLKFYYEHVLKKPWLAPGLIKPPRSEEHTSELQSLMRISYAVFCLKKKIIHQHRTK